MNSSSTWLIAGLFAASLHAVALVGYRLPASVAVGGTPARDGVTLTLTTLPVVDETEADVEESQPQPIDTATPHKSAPVSKLQTARVIPEAESVTHAEEPSQTPLHEPTDNEPPQTAPVTEEPVSSAGETDAPPSSNEIAAPPDADATADASTTTVVGTVTNDKPIPQRHLRKYIATLAAWIDQHKHYPGELKKQHVQGVVTVRFTVRRDGSLVRNEVDRSSGHGQLDEAALATLRACDPFPAFPRQIDRDELNIAVPIEYALIKNR